MKIGKLIPVSNEDYSGRESAVVYLLGCNFRCGFCKQLDLIPSEGRGDVSEIEFFEFLKSQEGKLRGVVITGGEPTTQADLPEFIEKIKEYGFSVKLITNGSNPAMLEKLIQAGILDFITMDIKSPLENYSRVARFDDYENIQKSVGLIMDSRLPYEFRAAVLPAIHEIMDFERIGKMLKGAEKFVLQSFKPGKTFDRTLENAERFSPEELKTIAAIMQRYVKEVVIRKYK